MSEEEVKGCSAGCAGCSGCHDHEDMELPEGMSPIITLTDEEGKDIKFQILDVVALEDERSFLIVAEADKMESEDVEVVILEIKEDGDEEVYDTVTDEKLAQKVFDEFMKNQEDYEEEE